MDGHSPHPPPIYDKLKILTHKLCACLRQFFSAKRDGFVANVRVTPIDGNASQVTSRLSGFKFDRDVDHHKIPVFNRLVFNGIM